MLSWYLAHRERLELKRNTAFELFHCDSIDVCGCVTVYSCLCMVVMDLINLVFPFFLIFQIFTTHNNTFPLRKFF